MEKDSYALFSAHHQHLLATIEAIGKRVEDDILQTPELLTVFYEQLLPHAQGEDATLYKRAETLPDCSTLVQTLRYEHHTIAQQVHEIEELFTAHRDTAQQNTLAALMSLIRTHFRTEEDVLIPRLRRHLTPEEFSMVLEEAHQIERTAKPSDLRRFLEADHRRVDRILEEISTMKRRALQHTKAVFARSKHGLLRHMAWEEELLFPVCEQKVQRHDTGPTAGMRQEHAQITAALEKMELSLAAGELTALNTAERDLVEVLTIHNRKEEQMLYPMLNHSLSPEERKALLDKFR